MGLASDDMSATLDIGVFSESECWLITAGKLEKALKELKKVAQLNGRKDAVENLNIEVGEKNSSSIMKLVSHPWKIS